MPTHHNRGEFGENPVAEMQRRQPNPETPRHRNTAPPPSVVATGGPDGTPVEPAMSLSGDTRIGNGRDIEREPSSVSEYRGEPESKPPYSVQDAEPQQKQGSDIGKDDVSTAASVVSALSALAGVL